jgi:hypothetical protein
VYSNIVTSSRAYDIGWVGSVSLHTHQTHLHLLSSAGYYSFTRRHFLICGFSGQLKSGTTKTLKRQCRASDVL